jgi:hypothetical protein
MRLLKGTGGDAREGGVAKDVGVIGRPDARVFDYEGSARAENALSVERDLSCSH